MPAPELTQEQILSMAAAGWKVETVDGKVNLSVLEAWDDEETCETTRTIFVRDFARVVSDT